MKHVVIIGGSRGIGAEILKSKLEEARCVNISRNEPNFTHSNLTHYSVNILSDELPSLEAVDQLIYCPGSITLKPIVTLKEEHFLSDYKINVIGAVKAIKKYLPQLKKGVNPSITLFSTVAVRQGMPFHASVASAKAAVEGLTKSLAAEFAPTIRVNCIAPTITDTDLASGILKNEKMKENALNRHPLKKILAPSDVASMAIFLTSVGANSITGQIFGVDAGLSTLKI